VALVVKEELTAEGQRLVELGPCHAGAAVRLAAPRAWRWRGVGESDPDDAEGAKGETDADHKDCLCGRVHSPSSGAGGACSSGP
jgi:hypothetical protein